ncbi:hypothetical protein [Halobacteriovorax sp.]|uniref:hypothetical protein n=1 Tax=Halobacteriovorax sp. TaxID=2020862 RepID=UPI003AF21CEB
MQRKISFPTLFLIYLLSCAFSCSSNIEQSDTKANTRSLSSVEGKVEQDYQELDKDWHDRGMVAKDNIERIKDKRTLQDLCIKDFERSFFFHAIPEHNEAIRGTQEDGIVYALNILHSSEQVRDYRLLKVTLINFYYNHDSELVKVDVPLLARGWRVQMSSRRPGGFVIDNSRCYYFINTVNPFESGVLSINNGKDI